MRHSMIALVGALALSACATTASDAPSSAAAGAPAKPVYLLTQISGKGGKDLDALLGAPDLLRAEGEGEFRRCARRMFLDDCSLS